MALSTSLHLPTLTSLLSESALFPLSSCFLFTSSTSLLPLLLLQSSCSSQCALPQTEPGPATPSSQSLALSPTSVSLCLASTLTALHPTRSLLSMEWSGLLPTRTTTSLPPPTAPPLSPAPGGSPTAPLPTLSASTLPPILLYVSPGTPPVPLPKPFIKLTSSSENGDVRMASAPAALLVLQATRYAQIQFQEGETAAAQPRLPLASWLLLQVSGIFW